MVAITILTVAMAGPLFTANRAIIAAQTARDQLTASYLAQEGIEYVRALRDNAYLAAYQAGGSDISGGAWTNFLTGSGVYSVARCIPTSESSSDYCTLDPEMGIGTQSCNPSTCVPLGLVVDGQGRSLYRQGAGGTPTPFTRMIRVTAVSPTEEKIVSTVSWLYHNTPYSVTVSDHLTPWQ